MLVGGAKIPEGPLVSVRVELVAVSERPVLLVDRLLVDRLLVDRPPVDRLLVAVRRLRLARVVRVEEERLEVRARVAERVVRDGRVRRPK